MTSPLKLNLYLFLMFFCSIALADTSQTKVLQLSAHIDNEDFFAYQVTKFGFEDSHIIVDYNPSDERFYSESTDMILETDIPVGFSAGFELIAKELSSVCENAAGETVQSDFASYWVDGERLFQDAPIHFDKFNNASTLYLNDKREFTVNFDALPSLDVDKAYCKGSATLLVSLDF
ncbi:conserved exported hypothetical protein [Vibrio jasicida]|uniref:hypothetical protein n=1 Tax=Vibrio jasicida TaxID=766224 RepID=UPI0028953305|nr:conserved exported hypothetical protein [Vibrio jasicida]